MRILMGFLIRRRIDGIFTIGNFRFFGKLLCLFRGTLKHRNQLLQAEPGQHITGLLKKVQQLIDPLGRHFIAAFSMARNLKVMDRQRFFRHFAYREI